MKKTNQRLSEVIKSLKSNIHKEQINVVDLLPSKFIEIDGCVLLRESNKYPKLNMDFIYSQFGDRSGFEAADSHVHMIDISEDFVEDPYKGLNYAMKIMDLWSYKLKLEFPSYRFVIYLTFHGNDTIIRFHKLREEEPTWIDLERIDEYTDEGIMILIV